MFPGNYPPAAPGRGCHSRRFSLITAFSFRHHGERTSADIWFHRIPEKSSAPAARSGIISASDYIDQRKEKLSMVTPDSAGRTAITTLDCVGLKGRCQVVGIRASGALRKRVLAMGMVPGAVVEVLRSAPLGDPTEYRVKGYCLSLRRAEASLIEVVLDGGGK